MNIVEVRSTTLDKLTFDELCTLVGLLAGVSNRGDLVEPALKELKTVARLRINQLRLEEDYRKHCELPPKRVFNYPPQHGQVMRHARTVDDGKPVDTWSADFEGIETRITEGQGLPYLSEEFKAAADIEAETQISFVGCQTGRVQSDVPNFSHPGQSVGHGEKSAIEPPQWWPSFNIAGVDAFYEVRCSDGSLHKARAYASSWTGELKFVTKDNIVLFDAVVTNAELHASMVKRAKKFAGIYVRGEAANPLIEDDVMVVRAEPVRMRMFDATTGRSYDPVEDDCDSPTVVE